METMKKYNAPLTEQILLLTNPMLRAGSGDDRADLPEEPVPTRRIPGSGL